MKRAESWAVRKRCCELRKPSVMRNADKEAKTDMSDFVTQLGVRL